MGRRKEHPRVPLPVVKRVEETVKRTIVTWAPPRSFQPWGAGAEVGRGQKERGETNRKGKIDSQKDRGRGDKPQGEFLRAHGPREGGGWVRGEGEVVETVVA